MTRAEVEATLHELGLPIVVSQSGLSRYLKVSPTTIGQAWGNGKLKRVDRFTYEFKDIVDWLVQEPRFLTRALERTKRTQNEDER